MQQPIREYETVIVGGGIAGLGCARTLSDHKKEFLLISKNIGGRIHPSKDKKTNFGAFFVTGRYKHVRKFTKKSLHLNKRDIVFNRSKKRYTILSWHFLSNIGQYVRLYIELMRFENQMNLFRRLCETKPQDEALKNTPGLHSLYTMRADEWVKNNNFQKITREFLDELIHAIVFVGVKHCSAYLLLQWISEVLLHKTNEFHFDFEAVTAGYEYSIMQDSVTGITKTKDGYIIRTTSKEVHAKNLVLATEPWIAKEFFEIGEINQIIKGCAYYVKGVPRHKFDGLKVILFSSRSIPIALCKEENGYILFSRSKDVDLSEFFSNYEVVETCDWDPAFLDAGPKLTKLDRGEGLYLVGSYNIEGMEDCYITGIYAANMIMQRKI
jgi:hypothetical protein